MMIFFSILRGPIITPHCTTGLDPSQSPLRLFPNRMVLPFRRLSRRRGRHQPTNTVEFDSMEMVREPLLNMALVIRVVWFFYKFCHFFMLNSCFYMAL